MAKEVLPVDFKDDILSAEMAGRRKYQMINNADSTVSLIDSTVYDQRGDDFGQARVNAICKAVNESADKADIIDNENAILENEQSGKIAGALAVKSMISALKEKITSFENTKSEIVSSWLGQKLSLTTTKTWAQVITALKGVSLGGNAAAAQVLSGYTFYNNSLTKQTGSMANNGSQTFADASSGSVAKPAGYYSGITVNYSPAYWAGIDSVKKIAAVLYASAATGTAMSNTAVFSTAYQTDGSKVTTYANGIITATRAVKIYALGFAAGTTTAGGSKHYIQYKLNSGATTAWIQGDTSHYGNNGNLGPISLAAGDTIEFRYRNAGTDTCFFYVVVIAQPV